MGWRESLQKAWWASAPAGVAQILQPLASLYRLIWNLRHRAYAGGWRPRQRLPVPVIVVGNLIVGGAGKTPTVIALVQAMRARGWTPGVISRGHGAAAAREPLAVEPDSPAADVGDEPLLIRRRTGAPVWVARQRARAGMALLQAHPRVDLIVADDGLQHLSLERDAQIVVFDPRGTGNGSLLPAGPLREPMTSAPPPKTAVLYNGPHASTPWPGHLAHRSLGALLPLSAWWAGDDSAATTMARLAGQRVLAAAGIGEPERFFALLESTGLRVQRLPLPDHAPLDPRPWDPAHWDWVIVTEKDAVKLPAGAADAGKIVVATLDFRIPEPLLDSLCAWLPEPPVNPAPSA